MQNYADWWQVADRPNREMSLEISVCRQSLSVYKAVQSEPMTVTWCLHGSRTRHCAARQWPRVANTGQRCFQGFQCFASALAAGFPVSFFHFRKYWEVGSTVAGDMSRRPEQAKQCCIFLKSQRWQHYVTIQGHTQSCLHFTSNSFLQLEMSKQV